MVHESYIGNGFCYRRFNKAMKKKEQLGYAGYFGAWTDNPNYWVREMAPNTQVHRNALRLKWVCWLSVNTQIDKVRLDPTCPVYDLYMYHGCQNKISGFQSVNCKISIQFSKPIACNPYNE